MRLYDISAEIRAVFEHIAEQEGEFTAEDEAALDELCPALEDKIARYLEIAAEDEAYADALKAEADRIMRRAQVKQNAARRLRGRVRDALLTSGIDKVDAGTFRVSLRKPRESVEVVDTEALPADFTKTTTTADKRAIGEALKAGREVPGARLVQGEHGITVR